MKIRCIAVDDEPMALGKLRLFARRMPQLELLAAFENAAGVIEFIQQQDVQLVFLDIRMEGTSGIELVARMPDPPLVIFTTAYSEYALSAFEVSATDYLLKPYTFERFEMAVNKAADYLFWKQSPSRQAQSANGYIFVKSGYKLVKVMLADILYIEGMRDFLSIQTTNARILANHTFQEIERMLPMTFIRCHKSWMVSAPRIESIERDRIRTGDKLIPIGESYKERFFRTLRQSG